MVINFHLTNKSSIPREKILAAIKFVWPKLNCKIFITIKNNNRIPRFQGCANVNTNRLVLEIGANCYFPVQANNRKYYGAGYQDMSFLKNIDELLINVLAHELRHFYQEHTSKQDFDKGQQNMLLDPKTGEELAIACYRQEADATKYSRKMILKYRKFQKQLLTN